MGRAKAWACGNVTLYFDKWGENHLEHQGLMEKTDGNRQLHDALFRLCLSVFITCMNTKPTACRLNNGVLGFLCGRACGSPFNLVK